jgi:hypothetical protein
VRACRWRWGLERAQAAPAVSGRLAIRAAQNGGSRMAPFKRTTPVVLRQECALRCRALCRGGRGCMGGSCCWMRCHRCWNTSGLPTSSCGSSACSFRVLEKSCGGALHSRLLTFTSCCAWVHPHFPLRMYKSPRGHLSNSSEFDRHTCWVCTLQVNRLVP